MAQNIPLIVFPVKDIDKAKAFYGKYLGVEPYAESPYYVGYKIGDQEVGLDPNATVGPIAYVDVEDIASSLQAMAEAGGEVIKDVTDVGGGLLVAQVKDTDENVVGFRQQAKL
jgi:predicted enzyme related to lactoylglutathione lyase